MATPARSIYSFAMRELTLTLKLEGPDDIHSALEHLRTGHAVSVSVGTHQQRPKSFLLHELVQHSCAGGATVHHPQWVSKGLIRRQPFMKSCVIRPAKPGPPEDPSGVREPRRPGPDPSSLRAARELGPNPT